MTEFERLKQLESDEVERRQQLRVELDNLELRLVSIRMRLLTLQKAKDLKECKQLPRAVELVWTQIPGIDQWDAERIVKEL